MKKQLQKTIILCFAISIVIACKKEDKINVNYKQQVSLQANGVDFSVTTGGPDVEKADAHIRSGNKFQLNATTSIKDFSISNQNVPGLGTYDMTSGNVLNFAQWEDGSSLFSSLGSPKSHLRFTITQKIETSSNYFLVEGTFSGVLYNVTQTDSVLITDGQVSIIE